MPNAAVCIEVAGKHCAPFKLHDSVPLYLNPLAFPSLHVSLITKIDNFSHFVSMSSSNSSNNKVGCVPAHICLFVSCHSTPLVNCCPNSLSFPNLECGMADSNLSSFPQRLLHYNHIRFQFPSNLKRCHGPYVGLGMILLGWSDY